MMGEASEADGVAEADGEETSVEAGEGAGVEEITKYICPLFARKIPSWQLKQEELAGCYIQKLYTQIEET